MIEMNVVSKYDEWTTWWRNFYDYYVSQGVDMDNEDEITRMLKEWRAIELDQESTLFYFENEQDQLLFMLRWA
jgi:hypothetical protein